MPMPNIRPDLLPLLTQIWNQDGGTDDLFSELSRTIMGSKDEASRAGTELKTARETLPTGINPIAEALTRAMGNAASMFTGEERGRETSSALITRENLTIQQKRKESLAALEDAYQRASVRAEKLGDYEAQMKFLTKRDATIQKREDINKVLLQGAEADIADKRLKTEIGARRTLSEQESRQLDARQQAEFAKDFVMNDIQTKAKEREALTKQAPAMGFLNTDQWSGRFSSLLNATNAGKPAFQKDKLRNRFLSELAPDAAYATNPDGWLHFLTSLPNPNNNKEYLFPRDSRNPAAISPMYVKKVVEYMQRYYPDWNPTVSAVDSVGR